MFAAATSGPADISGLFDPTPDDSADISGVFDLTPNDSADISGVFDPTLDYTYLATDPKVVEFDYTLRGEEGTISYTVYGGLNDALKAEPRSIKYYYVKPSEIDFLNKKLDDRRQKPYLDPLVSEIQDITPNSDDQARIAISLVKHIEYDYSSANSLNLVNKYPYEILYTEKGVCGGKSVLLAYLLRGLGYEVAIFHFDAENHDAVGIECPLEYSYRGTGYCFVESTTPNIITDSSGEYGDGIYLTSYPTIYRMCDGTSFDSVYEEYYDAKQYNKLYDELMEYPYELSQSEYRKWERTNEEWMELVDKYDILLED
jgi:hypothetical protein